MSAAAPTFLLIRHGETEGNRTRVVQRPEVPLNARGIAQAERLARRLRDEQRAPSLIVSSDLVRAAMTAARVRALFGVPLRTWPELAERNFGDLRGRAYADLGFDPMAPGYEPPAGESWATFEARVRSFWPALRDLIAAAPGTVAVVTHGLVCDALATQFFDLGGAAAPERWGNTALTVVDRAAPYRVRLLNCTSHLDDESVADGVQRSGF